MESQNTAEEGGGAEKGTAAFYTISQLLDMGVGIRGLLVGPTGHDD